MNNVSEQKEREKTCEQRIADHMKGRLEQYLPDLDDVETCKAILEEKGNDIPKDEDEIKELAATVFNETVCDDVLSVDVVTTYKVLLSWGGPSDQFEFDYDNEGDLVAGRYRFLDWFDGAVRTLNLDEAERLAEVFGIYHEPQNNRNRY